MYLKDDRKYLWKSSILETLQAAIIFQRNFKEIANSSKKEMRRYIQKFAYFVVW